MNKIERLDISSDLLQTFVVVAESGNATHASALLNRTQSAISVQVRKLEEALAVQLFERQARGMILTDDGRKLLPAARRALSEMHRVNALFATPLRGRIRIGIPDDYDEMILEKVLADFGRRHPEVEIQAQSGCTVHYPAAIDGDELDLAVLSGAKTKSRDAFHTEPIVWAASEEFSIPADEPVPLAYLDRSCWWRDVPIEALDRHKRAWHRAYVTTSFTSVKAAIRSGFAVGILPVGALGSGMRKLKSNEGFPALPVIQRVLLKNSKSPADLTSAMSDAIVGAQLS